MLYLSGLAKDDDQLPDNVFKIGNVPHDWLFQHGKYNYMIIEYMYYNIIIFF